jgi:hypothetical protein
MIRYSNGNRAWRRHLRLELNAIRVYLPKPWIQGDIICHMFSITHIDSRKESIEEVISRQ